MRKLDTEVHSSVGRQCGRCPAITGTRVTSRTPRRRVGCCRPRSKALSISNQAVAPHGVTAKVAEEHHGARTGFKQVPLRWQGPPTSHERHASKEGSLIMQHIKSCRSWQALALTHERLGPRMNMKHFSAMITHLTQLMVRDAKAAQQLQQLLQQQYEQPQQQQQQQPSWPQAVTGQAQAHHFSSQPHSDVDETHQARVLSNYSASTSTANGNGNSSASSFATASFTSSSGNNSSGNGEAAHGANGHLSTHSSSPVTGSRGNPSHALHHSSISSAQNQSNSPTNYSSLNGQAPTIPSPINGSPLIGPAPSMPSLTNGSVLTGVSRSNGAVEHGAIPAPSTSGAAQQWPTSPGPGTAQPGPLGSPSSSQSFTLSPPSRQPHQPQSHQQQLINPSSQLHRNSSLQQQFQQAQPPRTPPPSHLPPSPASLAGLGVGSGAAGAVGWWGPVSSSPLAAVGSSGGNGVGSGSMGGVGSASSAAAVAVAAPQAGFSPTAASAGSMNQSGNTQTVAAAGVHPAFQVAGGSVVDIPVPPGAAKLLDALLMSLHHGLFGMCAPRQLANTLWALSKLHYRPFPSFLSKSLAACQKRLLLFESQHIANVLYALALRPEWLEAAGRGGRQQLLERLFSAAFKRLPDFKPRELAMLLWAIGQLHSAGSLGPLGSHQGNRVVQATAESATEAAARAAQAGLLGSQELCNVLWAVAKLSGRSTPPTTDAAAIFGHSDSSRNDSTEAGDMNGHQGGIVLAAVDDQGWDGHPTPLIARPGHAWFASILAPVHAQLPLLQPVGLATVLLSLGQLGVRPHRNWVRHVLSSTLHVLPMCGPGELSSIVLALAYLGYPPDWAWTARWCKAAALKLPAFRSQELANSVWALGRLRRPLPGPLLARFLVASAAQSDAFVASETAQMLIGVSKMGYRPDQSWLLLFTAAFYRQLPHMSTNTIASVCASFALLGQRMPPMLVKNLLQHLEPQLPVMSPRSLATIMRSFGTLAHRPPAPWIKSYLAATSRKMNSFVAGDLASCLWGVAILGIRPGASWMQSFVQRATSTLLQQQQQQRASLLRSPHPSMPGADTVPAHTLAATAGIRNSGANAGDSTNTFSEHTSSGNSRSRREIMSRGVHSGRVRSGSTDDSSVDVAGDDGNSARPLLSELQGGMRGGEVNDRRRALFAARSWSSWSCWAVAWACARLEYNMGQRLQDLLHDTGAVAQQEESAVRERLAYYKAAADLRAQQLQQAAAEGGWSALQERRCQRLEKQQQESRTLHDELQHRRSSGVPLGVAEHDASSRGMQVLTPPTPEAADASSSSSSFSSNSSTSNSSHGGSGGVDPEVLVLQGLASWASIRLNAPSLNEAAHAKGIDGGTPTSSGSRSSGSSAGSSRGGRSGDGACTKRAGSSNRLNSRSSSNSNAAAGLTHSPKPTVQDTGVRTERRGRGYLRKSNNSSDTSAVGGLHLSSKPTHPLSNGAFQRLGLGLQPEWRQQQVQLQQQLQRSQPPLHSSQLPLHSSQPPFYASQPPLHGFQPPLHSSQPQLHFSQLPHSSQLPLYGSQPPLHASQPPLHASQQLLYGSVATAAAVVEPAAESQSSKGQGNGVLPHAQKMQRSSRPRLFSTNDHAPS